MEGLEEATLGAGCFWCVEAVFEQLDGVKSVVAGYTGGRTKNPTYEEVCSGTTGHAEVARITFDPAKITFREVLDLFWSSHDPTTLNRQGADAGAQYRSVIFYHDERQKAIALESRAGAAKAFPSPIVTAIEPLTEFYEAESYHQDYYRSNPHAPYCMFVIKPKLDKLRLRRR
jgi:peptide-methionine (S)-S-oxide reductase